MLTKPAAVGTRARQVPIAGWRLGDAAGILLLQMPIYEYRCTNEHRFEVLQRFSDEPLTECEVCGAPASRVLYPAAIHFKGSGFYSTDYGRRGRKGADGESKGDAKPDGASSGEGTKSAEPSKGEKAKAAEA